MSERKTIGISLMNLTGGSAHIILYHENESYHFSSHKARLGVGELAPEFKINFNVGSGSWTEQDYWGIVVVVEDGPNVGRYVSKGGFGKDFWQCCQLQKVDAGFHAVFMVDTKALTMNLPSGTETVKLKKVRSSINPKVEHVFVLMLENHSFDNIFAMSGIPGIKCATTENFNEFKGQKYHVQKGAPTNMDTDPGHEFEDVVEQLTGKEGQNYPKDAVIDNSGFVANYDKTIRDSWHKRKPGDMGDVMKCFDTPKQLPVIYQLATEFAICDNWFSSLPGPTWPNRFFVHGATSNGVDYSPSFGEMFEWQSYKGFEYDNGSIFDSLNKIGDGNWKIYSDDGLPQVLALKGINIANGNTHVKWLAHDLEVPFHCKYTFIEPDYGNIINGTYANGSSQHPMDGMYKGEALIKEVYETIRRSAHWEKSLLIITYDEHGGFYDSAIPPKTVAPGDSNKHNKNGFDFKRLGSRVPAVVVSPYIPKGTVDSTLYDHASIPATIEKLFGLDPLTERDKHTNDVMSTLSLDKPRTDCPILLNDPVPDDVKKTDVEMEMAGRGARGTAARPVSKTLSKESNAVGYLQIIVKSQIELLDSEEEKKALIERCKAIKTEEEATLFAQQEMKKINQLLEARKKQQQ